MNKLKLFLGVLACIGLGGCGWLEDNGVHMAYCLKDGAKKLAGSNETELVIEYEPLTGTNQIYDVEFCSNSLVLVTGKNGGTSTYHLNYVHVGQDFRLMKTNSATFITLRKVDGRDRRGGCALVLAGSTFLFQAGIGISCPRQNLPQTKTRLTA